MDLDPIHQDALDCSGCLLEGSSSGRLPRSFVPTLATGVTLNYERVFLYPLLLGVTFVNPFKVEAPHVIEHGDEQLFSPSSKTINITSHNTVSDFWSKNINNFTTTH